jgi:adenylate kinase
MSGIVRERLAQPDAKTGFVLDGFPRTVAQAEALDGMMDGRGPLVILDIVVPEEELVRRLGARLICASCGHNAPQVGPDGTKAQRCEVCGGTLVQRADDDQSIVLERLKVYHCLTEPLVEYYKRRSTFRSVNGAQPPDRVAADLVAAADEALLAGGGVIR